MKDLSALSLLQNNVARLTQTRVVNQASTASAALVGAMKQKSNLSADGKTLTQDSRVRFKRGSVSLEQHSLEEATLGSEALALASVTDGDGYLSNSFAYSNSASDPRIRLESLTLAAPVASAILGQSHVFGLNAAGDYFLRVQEDSAQLESTSAYYRATGIVFNVTGTSYSIKRYLAVDLAHNAANNGTSDLLTFIQEDFSSSTRYSLSALTKTPSGISRPYVMPQLAFSDNQLALVVNPYVEADRFFSSTAKGDSFKLFMALTTFVTLTYWDGKLLTGVGYDDSFIMLARQNQDAKTASPVLTLE